MITWWNYQIKTDISLLHRGLNLADGHFTTLMVLNGAIINWEYHKKRLAKGCLLLGLVQPNWQKLSDHLSDYVFEDVAISCYRVTLLRSDPQRGYRGKWNVPCDIQITLFMYPDKYFSWIESGINLKRSYHTLSQNYILAGIKTLSRTEQVVLSADLEDDNYQDVLLLDRQDHVIETSNSNIFFRYKQCLYTPALGYSGITGTMRQVVLSLASDLNLSVYVIDISYKTLARFAECFITNSLLGVVSVNVIDNTVYRDTQCARRLRSIIFKGQL